MSHFILRKKGTFMLNNDSENQCKDKGHREFKYIVKLRFPDVLDADGFVIEHTVISELIDSEIKNADSCENLAKKICLSLIDLFNSENLAVLDMSIRILPKGNNVTANIEYVL
jgi:hypothetical protein